MGTLFVYLNLDNNMFIVKSRDGNCIVVLGGGVYLELLNMLISSVGFVELQQKITLLNSRAKKGELVDFHAFNNM